MHLPRIATADNGYSLLSLTDSEGMAAAFGLDLAEETTQRLVSKLQEEMIAAWSAEVSGVAIDYRYAENALLRKAASTGLLVRLLEHPQLGQPPTVPQLLPHWGVEQVRQVYGIALVELWYHPQEAAALEKKKLLSELWDFCRYEQIDLVVELHVTELSGGDAPVETTEQGETALLTALQELRGWADLWALEYPGSALAAATVTSELDMPWVLASGPASYEVFKEQLRTCLEGGAHGALTGSALWREIGALRAADHSPNLPAIQHFIDTTGKDRVIELSRIIGESLVI